MDLRREIERETHPEMLRGIAKILLGSMEKLQADNDRLRKKIEEELRLLQNQLDLNVQLTALRKIVFGRSSEQRKSSRAREKKREKLLLHAQSLVPPPRAEEAAHLPTQEIHHFLKEEHLRALAQEKPAWGETQLSDWEEVAGFEEAYTEITIIERQYKKILHKRHKYRHTQNPNRLLTAPGPEKLLPGCTYSLDFALSVVSDKYEYHLPLERQRRQMQVQGLTLSNKTLYGLCLATATHLEKVREGIRKDILSAPLAVGIDETPWPILDKHDDDGYLWSLSNQAGSYYQFEPGRSGKVAQEMLQGYEGPIIHDCFKGYDRLKENKKITHAYCWAHARRKFLEIQEYYPKESKEILDFIDALFDLEREAKTWGQLKQIRREESAPLFKKIKQWLVQTKTLHLRESAMQKAVDYVLGHEAGFKVFLEDPKIPLSNNDAERALRHGVMGRKNFYGSKTINGADTAAILYTVIETCKKMELHPTVYIRYVITQNNHRQEALTPMAYAKLIRSTELSRTVNPPP